MTARFLSLDQVAEELGITKWQAYTLVRRGDVPAMRIGGRHQWRIARDDVESFIASRYEETRRWVEEHPLEGQPKQDSDDVPPDEPDGTGAGDG